jgi:hypothetical protein
MKNILIVTSLLLAGLASHATSEYECKSKSNEVLRFAMDEVEWINIDFVSASLVQSAGYKLDITPEDEIGLSLNESIDEATGSAQHVSYQADEDHFVLDLVIPGRVARGESLRSKTFKVKLTYQDRESNPEIIKSTLVCRESN